MLSHKTYFREVFHAFFPGMEAHWVLLTEVLLLTDGSLLPSLASLLDTGRKRQGVI